jgi:FtsH-binding integral membrane protein
MSIQAWPKQRNPRIMQRLLAVGYAILGAVIYMYGQHRGGAAFVIVGAAWFALSFTKFAAKRSPAAAPPDSPLQT